MTEKILVICVDYQSESETVSYVTDIRSQYRNELVDIVVVCNSGSEKLKEDLKDVPGLFLYDFQNNLGYFPAANVGLLEYLKESEMPSIVIVSNTDIRIKQVDYFDRLLNIPYGFDVLGPSIINLLGQNQNPFIRKRPTVSKLEFLLSVFRFYPLFILYSFFSKLRGYLFSKKDADEIELSHHNIYAPHGSFLIFSKSYFSKGGDLKHDCFLYGEELYVAETAVKYKMDVLFEKSLRVYHLEHVTTGLIGSRNKAKYLYNATKYILKKFYDKK